MAATETSVQQLKINKLSAQQYEGITTPSATELYFVTDGAISYNDLVDIPTFATVATTGSYNDLTNKPVIPSAQVNSDWNANSGIAQILNKPMLSTVALSGSYNDLVDKPTLNTFTSTAQRNAINSGITSTLVTQITTNKNNITTINNKIPSAATSSNQLADKAFVNSSINAIAAYYITSDVGGDAFATKAALDAGPYYHDGSTRTPTENDYAIVAADETHNNACTRYSYTGSQWSFQYVVNDTPFTQAQINAINSTITSTKVDNYDTHIADTTIHVTSTDKSNWNAKADDSSVVHKTGNESIAGEKTFTNLYSIKLKHANTLASGTSDSRYIVFKDSEDIKTGHIENIINDGSTTGKSSLKLWAQTKNANDQDVISEIQIVAQKDGTIYTKAPTPSEDTTTSKQIDTVGARNTKLQSYQPLLVSGTNIKTINNNSILGSGNLAVDGLPSQTSQSGKFLTTNGTSASWANIPTEIPSQSGNSGKFLTTNGSSVSWATVNALPSQTGNSGKYLTTDGSSASWGEISEYTAAEITTLWNSL